MRTRHSWIAGVLLAAFCLGTTVAGAEQRASFDLAVELTDLARVPPAILREAKVEVERTFLASGVRIVWAEPGGSPRGVLSLKVVVLGALTPRGDEASGEVILGRASASDEWAQVFYGRVVAAVEQRQISVGLALARTISHELGHLLLPPGSHQHFGIMQRDIDLEVPSLRGFTDEQSRLIRVAAMGGRRDPSRSAP